MHKPGIRILIKKLNKFGKSIITWPWIRELDAYKLNQRAQIKTCQQMATAAQVEYLCSSCSRGILMGILMQHLLKWNTLMILAGHVES